MPSRLRASIKTAGLLLLVIGSLAIVACGGTGSGKDSEEKTKIVATTGILADITRQLAGTEANVSQLVPNGADAHDFQISAKERAEIESSDLLVFNGAGLEAGIPVESFPVRKFELVEHAGRLLEAGEDHHSEKQEHADDSHEGDEVAGEHGSFDPHVWMDPDRIAAAVPALVKSLSVVDPSGSEGYRERGLRYQRKLRALVREMQTEMESISSDQRKLVTSHDSMAYFAERFDFEILPTPFPATGAEAEGSVGAIAEVEASIEQSGVSAVFPEAESNPAVLEMIAERTGVEIVTGLLIESLGPSGSYLEMMRSDSRLIDRGLGS